MNKPFADHFASVDMVVVAWALYWFNFEHFFAEARRVLKLQGS